MGTVRVGEREEELRAAGVRIHPPRYGSALQEFMETMDAFVIPYVLHDDVRAVTASNKLFKYFAAGRPVVISDMPHFLDPGPGMIYHARTAAGFVRRLREAVREDTAALRQRRREIARENSWERRGAWLRQRLEEVRAGGAARIDAREP